MKLFEDPGLNLGAGSDGATVGGGGLKFEISDPYFGDEGSGAGYGDGGCNYGIGDDGGGGGMHR